MSTSRQCNTCHVTSFDFAAIRATPTLHAGDTHTNLAHVSRYLQHLGYEHNPVGSTSLNKDLLQALNTFRRMNGMERVQNFDSSTRAALMAPRCGVPESPIGANSIGPWPRMHLTFTFGNMSVHLDPDSAKNCVRAAFSTWMQALPGFTFTEVPAGVPVDVIVEWRPANDPDFSLVGGLIAHADFPPPHSLTTSRLPLPLHFDDEEAAWCEGMMPGCFDIQTIALHEIGHLLGLSHSTTPDSVMFPQFKENHARHDLDSLDIDTARRLYGTV